MKLKPLVILIPLAFGVIATGHADTLQDAVNATIKTNPDVLAAANERNAVSEEINQARAGYFPTVDLAIGTGWEESDNPTTRTAGTHKKSSYNRDEASLNLRQMLFDGMATKNEVRRHTARTDSRAYSVTSAAENTALEAVETYLDVVRRQKLVDLASTNLEAHERTHDQIKLRSDRGVGRKADLDQSQGRVALAQANLVAEQSNLRDAETNYLRVVGITANALSDPQSPQSLLPSTVDDAIDQAINIIPR